MTLRNAFGDLALEATLQNTNSAIADVETAITAVDSSVDAVATAVTSGASNTVDAVELMSEQVILLRKLLKLMESQATIDSAQRQRVTVDSIAANLTLGTVTTVGTVSTVSTVSALPTLPAATTVNQFAGVDLRFQWAENARIAYNTGIRSKLTY